jgi:AbrB family looped-hinge helix DNA binding protein
MPKGGNLMSTVRLSSKNQIVLPREARKAMHLKGRDELLVVIKDDVTVIMPKPISHREALSGIGKGMYPKTHLNKERGSWQRRER